MVGSMSTPTGSNPRARQFDRDAAGTAAGIEDPAATVLVQEVGDEVRLAVHVGAGVGHVLPPVVVGVTARVRGEA